MKRLCRIVVVVGMLGCARSDDGLGDDTDAPADTDSPASEPWPEGYLAACHLGGDTSDEEAVPCVGTWSCVDLVGRGEVCTRSCVEAEDCPSLVTQHCGELRRCVDGWCDVQECD